jgi:hypothetical protein
VQCSEAWVLGPSRAGYDLRTTFSSEKSTMKVTVFDVMLDDLSNG